MQQKLGHTKFRAHGLRTPGEEITFTARPKIKSQSQIDRYGRSTFCLPHRPKILGFFDLCLHWVSLVRGFGCRPSFIYSWLLELLFLLHSNPKKVGFTLFQTKKVCFKAKINIYLPFLLIHVLLWTL